MTERSKKDFINRRLADFVRDVKIAEADRTDVVVDLRDADRARLELLAQEIEPVLKDIDSADDRFDFGISTGLQPRLWIDAVAHVHMGHDRRVFRFVRDTRLGRVVLSDTSDMAATADAVGRYIAERVIERERILAGDFETMKALAGRPESGDPDGKIEESVKALNADREKWDVLMDEADLAQSGASDPDSMAKSATLPEIVEENAPKASRGSGFGLGLSWLILGFMIGAAALLAAFWERLSALVS